MRLATRYGLLFALALLLAPSRLLAVGQQNGRIAGTVTEATSKSPLPGAEVTVTSSSLIGGPRTVQTNDDGTYELVELPAGSYDVQAGFPGSTPARRKVVVRMGETTPLNIAWAANLTEVKTYTVEEELHLTNPDSTKQGTVISTDQANRVATGRSYQNIAQEVAGVVDVGGGGNPQVKGGNLLMNRYIIDGMDVTDPVTNTFSANINFESIGSIEVLTGGMEAEYNSMGGVIALETKAGSDKFHIDVSGYASNGALNAGNANGSAVFHGVREFSTSPVVKSSSYQANLVVGGPIVKQRLWFNLAFEFDRREASLPVGPPLFLPHAPRKFMSFLVRGKLTLAATQKHLLSLSVSSDPAFISNFEQTNLQGLGITEDHQNQGGAFGILKWDYFASKNVNVTIPLGLQYQLLDDAPEGVLGSPDLTNVGMFSDINRTYDVNRPQHVNNDDGTQWYQGGNITNDRRYTVQFDPSVSLRGKWLGAHDAKIGLQARYVKHTSHFQAVGGGVSYTDQNGGPLESGLCDPTTGQGGCYLRAIVDDHFDNNQWGVGAGVFAQDRWKPAKWVTILPGFRFDWGMSRNTLSQTVSNLIGFGPRIGATFDLTGDSKTILSMFYGRANETLSLLVTANADTGPVTNYAYWNPTTKMFDKDPFQAGGPNGYQIDPKAATPHTDEVTAGIRREIFKDSVASVDYTFKRVSNIWDAVEVNQLWNPAGNRVIGYVDPTLTQAIYKYTTPNGNYRTYQGVDFVFESRPSSHFDFYLAYTLSWLYGPGAEEMGQITGGAAGGSPFYNPRQAMFFDGFLANDVRHFLKVRASYDWHGLLLGGFLTYATGAPLTKKFYENGPDAGYVLLRAPQGTDPASGNSANLITEFRRPDTVKIDVRVAYDFHELLGDHHLVLMADVFNVLNVQTPTSIENRDLPTYGAVKARQAPFSFQVGLKYSY